MCMFSYRRQGSGSNTLQSVSGTNIFARSSTEGRQYLVYSMTLKADAELAMILPLPVPWKIEASFVPTIADFDRLDERFRLPKETWHHLPQYNKFGFAVFKLKPGEKRIHPMAFEFPRSDSKRLFFPTVHIHDGEVHATADFDHILYCQQNPDEHFRRRPAGSCGSTPPKESSPPIATATCAA